MRPRNGEKVLQGCRFLGLWLGLPSDGLGSRGEEPGAGAGSVDSGGIPGPVGGRVRFRGGRPGAERGWFWRDPVTLAAILLFLSCIALNVSGVRCACLEGNVLSQRSPHPAGQWACSHWVGCLLGPEQG